MRMSNINMTTTVPRSKLLETLRTNRAAHARIVQEARDGYVRQAMNALAERLEQLRKGEVAALLFSLAPPQDYTEVYDNSIAMLEWNTLENIELGADEFRQLVRDEWDWSDQFLHSNSTYSAGARQTMLAKKK